MEFTTLFAAALDAIVWIGVGVGALGAALLVAGSLVPFLPDGDSPGAGDPARLPGIAPGPAAPSDDGARSQVAVSA